MRQLVTATIIVTTASTIENTSKSLWKNNLWKNCRDQILHQSKLLLIPFCPQIFWSTFILILSRVFNFDFDCIFAFSFLTMIMAHIVRSLLSINIYIAYFIFISFLYCCNVMKHLEFWINYLLLKKYFTKL